ncbi:MAG: transcriptional repressor LexA [Lachnospiraceae bacterium]|nr:transcriptional repressor LexA [Lachnospiraceae bacterium]
MPTGKITKKQQEILDYMKREILEKGYPPSVRQICEAVSLKSTSSVHSHLESLEKNGYIKKDATKPRAIEILDDDFRDARLRSLGLIPESAQAETVPTEFSNVPVIGKVAAGQPLLAVESIESYFPIPTNRLPNAETFMLQVQGESMINAGILNGDYVLVEKRSNASDGEMIVALVDDSATVKTFYKENGYYRLQPENDFMQPIIVQGELQILGKVIGVFRFL